MTVCNGVPYVYDSNNYVAQTDWPNGDMGGYTAELRRAGAEYADFETFVDAAVYVDAGAIQTGKLGGLRAMPTFGRHRVV
jgi:hypothetical protein